MIYNLSYISMRYADGLRSRESERFSDNALQDSRTVDNLSVSYIDSGGQTEMVVCFRAELECYSGNVLLCQSNWLNLLYDFV